MTIPDLRQEDKTVIITGSRRGIGRAMALAFAEAGADVVISDYVINDVVQDGGGIYNCIQAHTSAGGNQPPNALFWLSLGGSFVSNTREVVVGEIALSVTNGKDWERKGHDQLHLNKQLPIPQRDRAQFRSRGQCNSWSPRLRQDGHTQGIELGDHQSAIG